MKASGELDLAQLPEKLHYAHAHKTPGAQHYEVYLDGFRLTHCVEAHAAEGWAVIYVTDDQGLCLDENDELQTQTLHGRVEILRRQSE